MTKAISILFFALLLIASACQKEDPGITCGGYGYVFADEKDTTACVNYVSTDHNYQLPNIYLQDIDEQYELDVNSDGVADYMFDMYRGMHGNSYLKSYLKVVPLHAGAELAVRDTFATYPVSDTLRMSVRYVPGQKIDNTANWHHEEMFIWTYDTQYTSYSYGGWGTNIGCIGTRIKDAGGVYHYGWIKYNHKSTPVIVSSFSER